MNIYKASPTATSDSSEKMFVFPHKEKFLVVSFQSDCVHSVDILDRTELSSNNEAHYFDLSSNFNLIPILSEEMIDEKALVDFMNWTPDQKVYKRVDNTHNIEIQFQPESIANHAISHSIPAIQKHHITELFLNICKGNGVHIFLYLNKLLIIVLFESKVILCNLFETKTDEEVLYFLLLVYQELSLSQEETPVTMYGLFPEKEELTKEYLSTYIRNVALQTHMGIDGKYQGLIKVLATYYENN